MANEALLEGLRIARPCPADWNRMTGSDTARYCDLCRKTVYNLSEMTREEALQTLGELEGQLCARIYRRADGTLITSDCPVGAQRHRRKLLAVAAALMTLLAGCAAALTAGSERSGPVTRFLGRCTPIPVPQSQVVMGEVCVTPPVKPAPTPQPDGGPGEIDPPESGTK